MPANNYCWIWVSLKYTHNRKWVILPQLNVLHELSMLSSLHIVFCSLDKASHADSDLRKVLWSLDLVSSEPSWQRKSASLFRAWQRNFRNFDTSLTGQVGLLFCPITIWAPLHSWSVLLCFKYISIVFLIILISLSVCTVVTNRRVWHFSSSEATEISNANCCCIEVSVMHWKACIFKDGFNDLMEDSGRDGQAGSSLWSPLQSLQ